MTKMKMNNKPKKREERTEAMLLSGESFSYTFASSRPVVARDKDVSVRGLGRPPPSGLDPHVLPPGPPCLSCATPQFTPHFTPVLTLQAKTMAEIVGWRPAHSPRVPFFRELLFGDCDLRLLARKFWPLDTPECQNPLNLNPSMLTF